MSTATRSHRVHVKPRLTWKPITRLRWRRNSALYGRMRSGTRYFLFGLFPILMIWDREPGDL